MVRDWDEDTMRIVFHEYSHLITSNVAGSVPVWLNEGLAEFYSTFQLVGDREAMIDRLRPAARRTDVTHATGADRKPSRVVAVEFLPKEK